MTRGNDSREAIKIVRRVGKYKLNLDNTIRRCWTWDSSTLQ